MTPAPGGPSVWVRADLDMTVTSPAGRTSSVRVGDRDGVLRVDVSDARAVLASLPVDLRGALVAQRSLRATGIPVERWYQDVDIAVRGRVVVSRRGRAWRVGQVGVRPLLVAAGAAVTTLVVLLLLGRRPRG